MTPWCKSLRCCKWPQLAPSVDHRHQRRGVESPPRARAYRPAARRRELSCAARTESGPELQTPEARPQERASEMSMLSPEALLRQLMSRESEFRSAMRAGSRHEMPLVELRNVDCPFFSRCGAPLTPARPPVADAAEGDHPQAKGRIAEAGSGTNEIEPKRPWA